jgi:DNA polymerase-3 subunit delta'
MPLFTEIVGQGLALAILRRALVTEAAHAYLFAGPVGVGKSDAAVEFAAGLICADDGCGDCDACRRVRAGIHPDVETIAPEGTNILIDQVRAVNEDIVLRPFEATVRVYIVLAAETMNKEAASAVLKTLEEPPPHAHFILVSSYPEQLLPTIVSRCQRVPFGPTPAPLLAQYLVERYGLLANEAMACARAAQGNLAYGRALATNVSVREWRDRLIGWAKGIPATSAYDVQIMLDEILAAVEGQADVRVEALGARKAADLDWAADARSRARIEKLHEQRAKRERRRAVTDGLDEVMRTFAAWYRDLAAAAVGAEGAVVNHDYLQELQGEAFPARVEAYVGAVDATRGAMRRFRYNVDARCALEDMVLSMKEALL